MIPVPRPGVQPARLVDVLGTLATDVANLHSGSPGRTSYERLTAYLDWAETASRQLRGLASADDIQRLVFGGRYRDLLTLALSETMTAQHERERFRRSTAEAYNRPGVVSQHPVANALLSSELDEQSRLFEEARDALSAEVDHWGRVGALAVLDTSFYIEDDKKLEDVDFARLLGLPGKDIHLIVPMAVVDELDGLKRHDKARWRAVYTLGVLERVWRDVRTPRLGQLGDAPPAHDNPTSAPAAGAVTVGLFSDPRGHIRLPIMDDEIVDRAATVQALAGLPVTVVTYDTGMAARARQVGLKVLKLAEPFGDEPAKDSGRRRGQRSAPAARGAVSHSAAVGQGTGPQGEATPHS
ncbi:hypothetical protein I6A84_29630 [Frankia sp. CNm7]|uniref:PIN domain-containing protein n=1 Tax=Frankia nepalensis TaxID=1836974 RepID=A0A937USN4_9ACTN|nr:PIN domain-containing protein [Frankia nepalensis]MBL7502813.1 hypothetical protein [Frankia nepalensis]MBL7515268.1 hypothetical protein [Frankia nepalensis]MBL7522126.1 hypothetical protein [Frankia nepalensis]MBL7632293.1 hypothetical protein [Frankia nepalensis]